MVRTTLLFIISFLSAYGVNAQKHFEGRIVFDIEYLSIPEGKEGVEAMLPSRMVWMVKGKKSRSSYFVPMAGMQSRVYLPAEDSLYHEIDLLDESFVFKKKLSSQLVKYRFIKQDKETTHLGYDLSHALMQSAEGSVLEIWYTDGFQNTAASELSDLPYLPLIYTFNKRGIEYRMTAVSIQQESVDETYFLPSSTAVSISIDDLHKIIN